MKRVLSKILLKFLEASYISITGKSINEENKEGTKGDDPPWCWQWKDKEKG